MLLVAGRNRVPRPAAGITAFLTDVFIEVSPVCLFLRPSQNHRFLKNGKELDKTTKNTEAFLNYSDTFKTKVLGRKG